MALYRSPSLDSLSLQSWCEVWYLGTSFCKSTSHQPLEWLAFNTMLGAKILFRIQNQNFLALFLSLSLSLFSIYVSIYIHPSMHLSIFSIPLPFSSLFPMNFITSFGWQHLADIYLRVLMRCTFNSEKLFLFNLWWWRVLVFFFFLTLRNPAYSFCKDLHLILCVKLSIKKILR